MRTDLLGWSVLAAAFASVEPPFVSHFLQAAAFDQLENSQRYTVATEFTPNQTFYSTHATHTLAYTDDFNDFSDFFLRAKVPPLPLHRFPLLTPLPFPLPSLLCSIPINSIHWILGRAVSFPQSPGEVCATSRPNTHFNVFSA